MSAAPPRCSGSPGRPTATKISYSPGLPSVLKDAMTVAPAEKFAGGRVSEVFATKAVGLGSSRPHGLTRSDCRSMNSCGAAVDAAAGTAASSTASDILLIKGIRLAAS